jgi:hypothetical protein
MWLHPNNVGKNSADVNYNKLIAFPNSAAASNPAPAGADPVAAGAVTLPGATGTWTNLIAGTTSLATAMTNAGRIECLFQDLACRIPLVRAT